MFRVDRIYIDNKSYFCYQIRLPKSQILTIANDVGYISNRLLDVEIFETQPHLRSRNVVCANVGNHVKSIEELLNTPIENLTKAAELLGISKGMIVVDALKLLK